MGERLDYEPTGRRTVVRVRDGKILGYDEINPGDGVISPRIMRAKDGYFAFYGEYSKLDIYGRVMHIPVVEKRAKEGSIEWRHIFDENEVYFEHCLSVEEGYVFSGFADVQGNDEEQSEGAFAMLSETGELLWITTFPAEYRKTYANMWQNADGTILSYGNNRYRSGQAELLLSCIARDGTLLWEKVFEIGKRDDWSSLYGMIPVDGGFLAMNENENERVPSSLVFLNDELSVVWAEDISFPEHTMLINVWCMQHGNESIFGVLVQDRETFDKWIELFSAENLMEKAKQVNKE